MFPKKSTNTGATYIRITTTTQARPAAATPQLCGLSLSFSLTRSSWHAWQAQGLQFPFLVAGASGEVLLLCSQAGDISLQEPVSGLTWESPFRHWPAELTPSTKNREA